MDSLEPILRLTRLGRFADALRALEGDRSAAHSKVGADVLRAVLLEHVGEYQRALAITTPLLKSRLLTARQRSECEVVVGKILFDDGDTEGGLAHLQRAAIGAERSGDLHTLFDAKLFAFFIVSDRFGPAAGSSLLADTRHIATKLGDPEVTARLHLFVAQAEAKRGLLENAKRHIFCNST